MLTVDDREARQHPVYLAWLKSQLGHENIETKRLDFADYTFTGQFMEGLGKGREPTIGVECSTPSDLAGKVTSGRLAFQLSGMLERYDVSILLITNTVTSDKFGHVFLPGSPSTLEFDRLNDILFAAQCHGVIVVYCRNGSSVEKRLVQMYRYWKRPYDEHKTFRPQNLIPKVTMPTGTPLDSRVQALMCWPSVGEDRAQQALHRFGSIRTIALLSEQELKTIPGWGPGTAHTVFDWLSAAETSTDDFPMVNPDWEDSLESIPT